MRSPSVETKQTLCPQPERRTEWRTLPVGALAFFTAALQGKKEKNAHRQQKSPRKKEKRRFIISSFYFEFCLFYEDPIFLLYRPEKKIGISFFYKL